MIGQEFAFKENHSFQWAVESDNTDNIQAPFVCDKVQK